MGDHTAALFQAGVLSRDRAVVCTCEAEKLETWLSALGTYEVTPSGEGVCTISLPPERGSLSTARQTLTPHMYG